MKVGLVGVKDSLEIISPVLDEFQISYEKIEYNGWEEELTVLLKDQKDSYDVWLFSGQVPYFYVKEWGIIKKPLFYVPHSESSLYKTLFYISHDFGIQVNELSFDYYQPEELKDLFKAAGIREEYHYLKSYTGVVSGEELYQFHYNLWKKGLIKAGVTNHLGTYLKMKENGMMAFRILPTKSATVSVLHLILRTYEMLKFKDSQISVQMIEFDPYEGIEPSSFSTDEIYNIELKLHEKLIKYARKVQGSLKPSGLGRYVIFTTRGNLEQVTNNFTQVPEIKEFKDLNKTSITCGIGIGHNVYEAEIHAGKALLSARKYGKDTWMTYFDDKTILGPMGRENQLHYSYSSEELQKVSRITSLSVSTIGKIKYIIDQQKNKELSAYELAQSLDIKPRSARRLLTQLEEYGFATVSGSESPSPRGRPRKLYRLHI